MLSNVNKMCVSVPILGNLYECSLLRCFMCECFCPLCCVAATSDSCWLWKTLRMSQQQSASHWHLLPACWCPRCCQHRALPCGLLGIISCLFDAVRGNFSSQISHLSLLQYRPVCGRRAGCVSKKVSLWMLYHNKKAASLCLRGKLS